MTLAIPDGEIDCAAALWLQRLRTEERLPEKGFLETLRRREERSRQHAEVLAESERNRADLAVESLAKERHFHSQRENALKEVQAALKKEQERRAEAEASISLERKAHQVVKEAQAEESRRRVAAEARLEKSQLKVRELQRHLEDDESLRVLDEFRQKLDSQRREISSLRQQLSAAKDEAAAKAAMVEQGKLEFSEVQEKWTKERLRLISQQAEQKQELIKARQDLVQLSEVGRELQASAEGVAHAMQNQLMIAQQFESRPDTSAKELAEAKSHGLEMEQEAMRTKQELLKTREELVEMRQAGHSLQAAVEGILQMCEILKEFMTPTLSENDI